MPLRAGPRDVANCEKKNDVHLINDGGSHYM